MAVETYSITSDFSGTVPSVDLLTAEVSAASLGVTLQGISVRCSGSDNVDLVFDSTPSAGDLTTLAAVIAAHDPAGFSWGENHELEEYSTAGRLLKKSWWARYNSGSDIFEYKVREQVYSWTGAILTQMVETSYDIEGNTVGTMTKVAEEDQGANTRRWRRTV